MGYETAIIKGTDSPTQRELLERGARLRSELLDAFSRLEEMIVQKLGQQGKSSSGASLTHKLDALEKTAFRYPAKAKQLIAEIRPLVDCRNDIVHSALALAEMTGGETNSYFVFRNVSAIPDCTGRRLRALTAEEFKMLVGRVKAATKHLKDQPTKATTPAAPATATGAARPPTPQ
ncbi:MAG: hypothetical protein ACTHJU_04555 [Sphingopyxis sp.]